jgi:hypothetical protein
VRSSPTFPSRDLFTYRARLTGQLTVRDGWHLAEGVDLTVRMRDGGAHFSPTVLEHEYIRDVCALAQGFAPFCPQRHDVRELPFVERTQAGTVVRGEQYDLGAPIWESWPTVLEPKNVVLLGRFQAPWAEGAGLRGQIRAFLAAPHNYNWPPAQRVHPPIGFGTAIVM